MACERFNIEAGAVAAPQAPAATSLAALLTRHILRDGELVLLILKPSVWYILISSIRFAAVVLIGMIAVKIFGEHVRNAVAWIEAGIFLIAGRVMWAVLQWTTRLYVLTDMRILRIAGVFSVDIFDCPLRKVARVRIIKTFREKIFALGSIEIIPSDENFPIGLWQTVARPQRVQETIVAAINRAKHTSSEG